MTPGLQLAARVLVSVVVAAAGAIVLVAAAMNAGWLWTGVSTFLLLSWWLVNAAVEDYRRRHRAAQRSEQWRVDW